MTRLNVAGFLREPAGSVRRIRLREPMHGSLQLHRTNRGILVQGTVRGLARRTCVRCLDEFDEPVRLVLNEEFLPTVDPATGAPAAADRSDADVARLDAHHELDLGPILADELALAEPMHPLCRPDCPGLCAICGRRIDQGHGDHQATDLDPRLAPLADWKRPVD